MSKEVVVEFRYANEGGIALFGAEKTSEEKANLLVQYLDEFENFSAERDYPFSFRYRGVEFDAGTLKKAFVIHRDDGSETFFEGTKIGQGTPRVDFCKWWRERKLIYNLEEKEGPKPEPKKGELAPAKPRHHYSLWSPWDWGFRGLRQEIDDLIASYAEDFFDDDGEGDEKFYAAITVDGSTVKFHDKKDFLDFIVKWRENEHQDD